MRAVGREVCSRKQILVECRSAKGIRSPIPRSGVIHNKWFSGFVPKNNSLRRGSRAHALSHRTKLHIIDYNAVLAAHSRFVLAAEPGDYLPWHLVNAGYRVVPIGSSRVPVLYEVEAPRGK